MTRFEALDDLKALWVKYSRVEYTGYLSSDFRIVEELLDDVEQLLKG